MAQVSEEVPMARLRIVSDGTSAGTQVLASSEEAGEHEVELVTSVWWEVKGGERAVAHITVADVAVDVVGEAGE